MLVIQVLLGGITRLTGSGLSITEWKPLLGIIPPLNETEWQRVFQLYQEKTGQFKYVNNDFTLSDFKFIYFWEYLHRAWAWMMAYVVFLPPFIFFLVKKYFIRPMVIKLVILFGLGFAQGLIGMIMVMSGLNDQNLYVSHIRLAIHFISALVLIGFTFWFALSLLVDDKERLTNSSLKQFTIFIIFLLGIQLVYGAFMAGLKAATAAATWPDINGEYFPATLANGDFLHNPINIHFVHRMMAYLLLILIVYWFIRISRIKNFNLLKRVSIFPLVLVFLQAVIGICTVLFSTHTTRNGFGIFEYLAQAHQLVAMFLLMSLVAVWYLLAKRKTD